MLEIQQRKGLMLDTLDRKALVPSLFSEFAKECLFDFIELV